ncbi:MAG: hypothetical protein Q8N91_02725 [Candidatus Omnitrophota bacterium]|nr:hypothetical protein [Candidatus Omnitrophota bacterium]
MKKIFGSLSLLAIVMAMVAGSAFAATTQTQTATVSVASILSIEFASTTDTTFGGGGIPWTSIDPTSNLVYPTGQASTKAETAVI